MTRDTIHHTEITELINALSPLAATVRTEALHWITTPSGDWHLDDDGGLYCHDCAEKVIAELRQADPDNADDYFLDGGWQTEEEIPPICPKCGVKLEASPLAYWGLWELEHFAANPPTPGNAAHAYEVREMLVALEVTDTQYGDAAQKAAAIARKLVSVTPDTGGE
ncbi:hypothetical protein [Oceaniradius stylonematis]|uniref:hypothetical protein n=1 Tax=Oceaniradius stylonematis TaxID=2184161 RepID=UPI00273DD794|nr:hypothetical protein [Oceaniradius stylonematis]